MDFDKLPVLNNAKHNTTVYAATENMVVCKLLVTVNPFTIAAYIPTHTIMKNP